jgi:hypothetical protein
MVHVRVRKCMVYHDLNLNRMYKFATTHYTFINRYSV